MISRRFTAVLFGLGAFLVGCRPTPHEGTQPSPSDATVPAAAVAAAPISAELVSALYRAARPCLEQFRTAETRNYQGKLVLFARGTGLGASFPEASWPPFEACVVQAIGRSNMVAADLTLPLEVPVMFSLEPLPVAVDDAGTATPTAP